MALDVFELCSVYVCIAIKGEKGLTGLRVVAIC